MVPFVPYKDPTGMLVTELRTLLAPHVPGLTVRGVQMQADDTPPLIIVDRGGILMVDRTEVQRVRMVVRCYGHTSAQAAELLGWVLRALNQRGPRISNKDVGIYLTRIESTGGSLEDPHTYWPYEYGSFLAYTASQAVVASSP